MLTLLGTLGLLSFPSSFLLLSSFPFTRCVALRCLHPAPLTTGNTTTSGTWLASCLHSLTHSLNSSSSSSSSLVFFLFPPRPAPPCPAPPSPRGLCFVFLSRQIDRSESDQTKRVLRAFHSFGSDPCSCLLRNQIKSKEEKRRARAREEKCSAGSR